MVIGAPAAKKAIASQYPENYLLATETEHSSDWQNCSVLRSTNFLMYYHCPVSSQNGHVYPNRGTANILLAWLTFVIYFLDVDHSSAMSLEELLKWRRIVWSLSNSRTKETSRVLSQRQDLIHEHSNEPSKKIKFQKGKTALTQKHV